MAINVDHLRAGLGEYSQSLDQHARILQQEFGTVQSLWAGLNADYDGVAAGELAALWSQTARFFEAYLQDTQFLILLLNERTEHLKQV